MIITKNEDVDAVLKWIEEDKKRSEQLKALITTDNKETVVKILEIVYDRVMDCEGTLLTESGEKVANVIDGQDAMDAICCTIEEVKNIGIAEVDTTLRFDETGYNARKNKNGVEVDFVIDGGAE